MSHEPECDDFQNGYSDGNCICHLTRPAYQRGREDAAKAVEGIHNWEESNDFADFRVCEHTDAVQAARGGEQG